MLDLSDHKQRPKDYYPSYIPSTSFGTLGTTYFPSLGDARISNCGSGALKWRDGGALGPGGVDGVRARRRRRRGCRTPAREP